MTVLIVKFTIVFEVEIRDILNSCEELHGEEYQNQNEPAISVTIRNRAAGRSSLVVTREQLEGLQKVGFSSTTIASMLGISYIALPRRRSKLTTSTYGELMVELCLQFYHVTEAVFPFP